MLQFLANNPEVAIAGLTVLSGVLIAFLTYTVPSLIKMKEAQIKVEEKVDVVESRTQTQNGGTVGSYSEDVWHEIKDVAEDLKAVRELMRTSIRNQGKLEYGLDNLGGKVEEQGRAIRGVESQLSAGASRFAIHEARLKALEESAKSQ